MLTINRAQRFSWLVFGVLVVVYAYFFPRWADWNQNSRFDLVLAVVDKGVLTIDDYYQNTGDYAEFNGHMYSDKAPGTSIVGIPIYWFYKTVLAKPLNDQLVRRLAGNAAFAATLNPEGTGLVTDKINFFLALTFVTFWTMVIPSALMGMLFYRLLGHFSASSLFKLALTFAFGIATPAFAYANLFYGHQLVAATLFSAFYVMFYWRARKSNGRLVLVGFLFAFALITEYPTALIVAGVGLYTLYQVADWRRWIWIVLGGLPPLLLDAVYNYAIFGTPLPVGYEHSALWQDVHSVGFLSLTLPQADALWGITFGSYRGLFLLAPFLLLAIPGFYFFWRARTQRAEFWVTLWCVVSFFLFNGSSAMWSGGFAVGPRYLVPVLPFLALPIIFLLPAVRSKLIQAACALAMLGSLVLVWIQTIGGQSFPQFQPNALMDYSLPRILAGDIARNVGMVLGLRGWSSLIPLLGILFVLTMGWVFWERRSNEPAASLSELPS